LHSPKPLVVFVVGHEKWGKSWTFRALSADAGSRRVTIGGITFHVRRSSNDDITKTRPNGYKNYIRSLSPALKPYVIAALCPKFNGMSDCDNPMKYAGGFLKSLKREGYRLFFWIIEHKWRKRNQTPKAVSREEISVLRKYAKQTRGRVKVFSRENAESSERARELRIFVSTILRA
jgi:hypothetical protein